MSSDRVELKGGLDRGSDNGVVLASAAKKLVTKKKIRMVFPEEPAKKKKISKGELSGAELSTYVDDRADEAFRWITTVAKPFLHELKDDVEKVGSEVEMLPCEDGDKEIRKIRKEEYEETIEGLLLYSPENEEDDNDTLLKQSKFSDIKKQLIELMCFRVRQVACIAILTCDLAHAESKEQLENLLENAEDGRGEKAFAQTNNGQRFDIKAFNNFYVLTEVAFEDYRDFAREKLAPIVAKRTCELAKAHKKRVEEREKKVQANTKNDVSPEELFFGENADGMTTTLSWLYGKERNAVQVKLLADNLYILNAIGRGPEKSLKDMRTEFGSDPYVPFKAVVHGECLCLGQLKEGRPRYEFGSFLKPPKLMMASWVRTGAGHCMPDRHAEGDETRPDKIAENGFNGKPKSRITKEAGELLTDQEFLYRRGLGNFDLVFPVGFHYEPRDEEGKPNGQTFNITEQAVARIERKEVEGRDKIALKKSSTEELTLLLEAGGAVVGHEFFEGTKGESLPIPIRLGIGQAFARLKISESTH